MSIVFDGDYDDKAWCDPPCDGLLVERKDESMLCTICGRTYLPGSVNKHKSDLAPAGGYYANDDGPLLEPLVSYTTTPQKKKPTAGDKEDKMWLSQGSGRTLVDVEEWTPE